MPETSQSPENASGGQPLTHHPVEPVQSEPSIIQAKANENTGITKLNDHLMNTNCNTWKGQMMLTLEICGVEKYVIGTEDKPDLEADWLGFHNWEFND